MLQLHGVHLAHHKNTANCPPVRLTDVKELVIPMSMHIGAPATPLVAVGEEVKVGQKIAEAGGFVSAPIYSGVSGKVKKIEPLRTATGAITTSIVLENDGAYTVSETVKPPKIETRDDFLAAVRESGVVGLGGAGFPTMVKLNVPAEKIDYVVVNGAECEPYITSDTRTMLDDADALIRGILLLETYLGAPRAIIGVEKNKPACIDALTRAAAGRDEIRVQALPSVYPQGGEKVLAYHTTGRIVKEGKLPIDVGVIVINCTTLVALTRYIETGMPLVEKCVTVDGDAVREPKNVIAPIGTPAIDLIHFCGGYACEPKKILFGGPMMGSALRDENAPILRQTNAILAFGEKLARTPDFTACIRCGKCVSACPFRLMPNEIGRAYDRRDAKALTELKVNLCMECGCCSYICPAKRPLVQQNRLAKDFLREEQKKEEAKKEGGKA